MELREHVMRKREIVGAGSGTIYTVRSPSPLWLARGEDETDEQFTVRVLKKCVLWPKIVDAPKEDGEIAIEDICEEDYWQLIEQVFKPSADLLEKHGEFFRKLSGRGGIGGEGVRSETE